jgi:uncharacterized protein (DUF302 family)
MALRRLLADGCKRSKLRSLRRAEGLVRAECGAKAWSALTDPAYVTPSSRPNDVSRLTVTWAGRGLCAMTTDGLTTIPTRFGPKETMDRLEGEIRAKGMTIFARIDHRAGAAQAGLALRPTELLIFGNASGGTPLMQANQTIGIDLPLRALVWQDEAGAIWLSYNDPAWLARRHGIGSQARGAVGALVAGLRTLARRAALPRGEETS